MFTFQGRRGPASLPSGTGSRSSRTLPALLLLFVFALLPLMRGTARADAPASEPLIAPDEMLSIDQIRPGMKGYGKSVFEGTKIERFGVTVLGVLRKIDFGGDMILIRIDDGPPVKSGSGVSAGMSGSPIYVDDKLIGALAFAWSFAKEPVAGVTPIAQMLENYQPGSAPQPPVATAQAGDLKPEGGPLKLDGQLFARATVLPDGGPAPRRGDSTLYMSPVATPVMVAGMGRAGLEEMKRRLGRFSAMVAPGPGRTELPPAERPKLEPGAAVGVQLLSGDIDSTAIGTVTYVKGDVVLAFGHPMFGLGSIDMPMTTAFIHGIISSQEVSFKLGSPVETVGHITQDRNWSIGGKTGSMSPTVGAEFVISDTDRGVKRDYKVQAAVHRDLTPTFLYSSLLNAVSSVSPPSTGTTKGVVEVWPKGMPVIRRDNVFAMGERRSQLEQLFGDPLAGMPLVELLQILDTLENNTFGSVPVERIRVAVDVSEKRRTASIERAFADRKSVKPGDTLKVGVIFRPLNGPKETREYEVQIPKNIPGGRLQIGVSAGSAAERVRQLMQVTRPQPRTLSQQVAQIAEREQNNELVIEMAQPVVGIAVSGREFPNLPNVVVEVLTGSNPSGVRMVRSHSRQSFDTPWVLSGAQVLTLQVDSDEKDKSGTALAPGGAGAGLGSLLDLFRIGLGGGGDLNGELGGDGDDGALGTGDDGDNVTVLDPALRLRTAANPRRPVAGEQVEDPAMPSFEELQLLLESDGAPGTGSEGGAVTSVRKGVGRGPGVWRMSTAKDFQGGKLEGVLVSSRGELALAPEAKPLLTSPDRFFWAQATDSAGAVYTGGWLDGSILKIDGNGQHSKVFDPAGEVAVSALASDPDGTVYAAAEPSGTIYRISPDGKSGELCKLPNERVWVLKRQGDALYAGTGSEGRLYRITPDGKASVVFTAPDRHILALAEDGQGALYCGTYPRGKVFRVKEGRAEPVYELPNTTVTSLACDGKGNLYIGTSPRAAVVKLTPSGDASVLFQSKEKHVLSLLVDDAGNVYAGVGRPAKVYRIAPDKTVSTLWEPQAAYVLSLTRDGAGNVYATTAGPTQVVRLSAQPAGKGTFTSAVLNAGNFARWGAVRWSGSEQGMKLQTRTGNTSYPDATWSAWSDPYTAAAGQPVTSPPGQYLQYRVSLDAGSAVPSLRSLEVFYRARNRAPEVTLKAPAAAAVLSGTRSIRWSGRDPDGDRLKYDVYYAPEGSDKWVKIGSRSSQGDGSDEDASDDTSTASVPSPSVPAAQARPARSSARRATRAAGRHPRSQGVARSAAPLLSRSARPRRVDTGLALPGQPEGDTGADASATPEADTGAGTDAEELLGGSVALTWNTKKVPDGRYRIKVVATDVLTSPDEPATGEGLSETVLVDNGPPQITLAPRRPATAPPAEAQVKDAMTYVASAEYRVDGGEWMAAAAADGIFDSQEETVKIDPALLKPGRHMLEIRTRDAAGNEKSVKTPYVLPASTPKK